MSMSSLRNGASHLLDREPPADYLDEWTQRIAAENKVVEPGTSSVVIFRVGLEWIALPTAIFQEVSASCVLHTMPHRRGGIVAGLVTIRGELLLCASLAKLLGIEQENVCRQLLVASRDGKRVAFPVDEVHGVVPYHARELKPVPATLAQSTTIYTLGLLRWRDRTVGCLDDELLFYTLDKSFA